MFAAARLAALLKEPPDQPRQLPPVVLLSVASFAADENGVPLCHAVLLALR